jgi:PAS domain S-box-containing protein
MGGRIGTGSSGTTRNGGVTDGGVTEPATPGGAPVRRAPDRGPGPAWWVRRVARPIPIFIAAIAVYDLAVGSLWLGGLSRGGALDHLTGAAALPCGVAVILIALRVSTAPQLDPQTRRAWPLIAAGIISYGLGAVALFLGGELGLWPLGAMGVALQLADYPLVGAGLASLAVPFEKLSDAALAWLDVCIIAWSTAILTWHFALYPVARETGAEMVDTLHAAWPPVGDLALVFAAGGVLLRGARSTSQRSLLLAAGSLFFLFMGDLVAGVQELRGTYAFGGLPGVFYGFGWLGLVSAAYVQLIHSPRTAPSDLSRYRRVIQWLPYIAVFVAFVGPPLYHWNDLEMLEQHVPATGFLMALLVARLVLTARQNASLAVAERARLAMAVEQAAEAILTTDRHWRVTYVNAAVARITGYRPHEVLGQDVSLLRDASDAGRFAEMRASVEHGEAWHGRFTMRRRDGDTVELDMAAAPILERGATAGSVVLARDMTRERALESQLAQTQRMEAVGRLAGGIAHDFNNILTAISGFTELAASSLPADHPASTDLREVLKASDRAAGLTRDLLAFGRRQVMQPRLVDLNEVIEGMRTMLERTLGEDVALRIRPQSGLGLTLADRGRMEQVVLNLAVNARDAMPDGGMLTIATADVDLDEAYARSHAGTSAGRYVSMSVADTGVGMPPDVLEHVFEPFYTTKPRTEATGLGLSIVNGIVEQTGGFIVVDSSPGSGTVFTVFLPRTVSEPAREADEEAAVIAGGTEAILVAEDEAPVRRVIERVLKSAGYRVYVTANGHEALALAPTLPHLDLLLTDVVMPGMSGVDLARQLTLARPDLRVIFASGYTGDSLIRAGARETVPFLDKPFTAETLLLRVREVLDRPVGRSFD